MTPEAMNSTHTGSKYHRTIMGLDGKSAVIADVYSVLVAFDVTCPAIQHAIKKLLCAGIRGKGDRVQDLVEARDAINRAIDLAGVSLTTLSLAPHDIITGKAPRFFEF